MARVWYDLESPIKRKNVTPEYLSSIIVQRCEFDDAAMDIAVPVDAGAVEAAIDDAGSLGLRGVRPGVGKGRLLAAPVAPTRKLPPGGTLGFENHDMD